MKETVEEELKKCKAKDSKSSSGRNRVFKLER
jgi:hypothetical protein